MYAVSESDTKRLRWYQNIDDASKATVALLTQKTEGNVSCSQRKHTSNMVVESFILSL